LIRTFDTPITTNDLSIDRVLAAGLPVVLVFLNGAPPSDLTEAMSRLARDNAGQVLIAQVQVKDNPETTRRYEVRQPPSVVALKAGQVQSKAENISAADLEQHFHYLLGRGPKPEMVRPAEAPNGARPAGSSAHPGRPFPVTDATFDKEVLGSPQPVLVDFWAPWCGPCRIVEPTVEKMAYEMGGRARFAKVNVDENPAVAARYGVQGIPTMMVVKNGQIIDRWTGALPEPALRSRVTPLLGG
jgi:thioredoxin 1